MTVMFFDTNAGLCVILFFAMLTLSGLYIACHVRRCPPSRFLIKVVLFQPTIARMAQLSSAIPVPVFPAAVVPLLGGYASVPASSPLHLPWLPSNAYAFPLSLPRLFRRWTSLGSPSPRSWCSRRCLSSDRCPCSR